MLNQQNHDKIQYLSKADPDHRLDGWHDIVTLDHFWIQHRQRLIFKHFGQDLMAAKRAADVGCGRGLTVREIGRFTGRSVDGFELNEHALLKCPALPGDLYVYNFFDFNEKFHVAYDLFLLLDVLEHVKEDVDFMKALAWHLRPGGRVLINVPSNQTLFSRYDEAAGHHRRYDAAGLGSVLERSGFRVQKFVNWGYVYVPLVWARQILSRNIPEEQIIKKGFETGKLTNTLLGLWSKLDPQTDWKTPGTSLLMLAEKAG